MVSVLISVVSITDSVHGQSADESRKAAFALFKKLKVCLFLAIIIWSNEEWSSQLWTQFTKLREKPDKKKIRTSTGFEPVTSRYRSDALTNWAIKPLMLGVRWSPDFFFILLTQLHKLRSQLRVCKSPWNRYLQRIFFFFFFFLNACQFHGVSYNYESFGLPKLNRRPRRVSSAVWMDIGYKYSNFYMFSFSARVCWQKPWWHNAAK